MKGVLRGFEDANAAFRANKLTYLNLLGQVTLPGRELLDKRKQSINAKRTPDRHRYGRRDPPRDAPPHERVRRVRGGERRLVARAPRLHPRAHWTERGREDDRLQSPHAFSA